jgi:hypothetical protein
LSRIDWPILPKEFSQNYFTDSSIANSKPPTIGN